MFSEQFTGEMMTMNDVKYEQVTVTLPVGLRTKAKMEGFNVSAVCADALSRKLTEQEKLREFTAWCLANPGNSYETKEVKS